MTDRVTGRVEEEAAAGTGIRAAPALRGMYIYFFKIIPEKNTKISDVILILKYFGF